MSEAEQYRRFVDECLNLAEEEEDSGARRKVLLEMTLTWMKLARRADIETWRKSCTRGGGVYDDQMDNRSRKMH